jgi:hypothetical protein
MIDVAEVEPPRAGDVVELVDEVTVAEPLADEGRADLNRESGERDARGNRERTARSGRLKADGYTSPWSSIAFATFRKPPMLAPLT